MRTNVRPATQARPAPGGGSGSFLCLRASLVRELTVVAILLVKAYSCFIGAFFVVFVPQNCTTKVGTTEVSRDCTFAENVYEDIDRMNAITLALNAVTAASLLAGFYFEWRRERWIIEHLDVDYSRGEDALAKDILGHETLRQHLHMFNQRYFYAFLLIGAINVANVGLSIYFLTLPQWFAGYRTVTTFLTSFALLFRYLVNSVLVSSQSEAETKALSVNLVEPVAFNVVGTRHQGQVKVTSLGTGGTGGGAGAGAVAGAGVALPAAAGAAAVAAPLPYYATAAPPPAETVGWGLAPPPVPRRYAESEV